jgi:DNA-binding NarL/FixJ family response regulator
LKAAAKTRRPYRTLIADRGGVFRLGLKKLFAVEDDFRVVAQAENASQTFDLSKRFKADLVMVQSEIAREGQGDLLARLNKAMPKLKILVITDESANDDPMKYTAQGADGVVVKSSDPADFVKSARQALRDKKTSPILPPPGPVRSSGETRRGLLRPADTLTRREKSIISCLLQGWRNREIAGHLAITEQTVKNHLRTIFDKVGVSDRLELVLYAIHHRLELPPVTSAEAP